jgi:hypothetical protein
MDIDNSPAHKRVEKMLGAYTAFIAAAVISLISGDGHIKSENWAICLWVISLPWLISIVLIDFIVRGQQRQKSATRGFIASMGLGFSNLGTAALLTHYSWIAAIVYLISIPICMLYLHEVGVLGRYDEFKNL